MEDMQNKSRTVSKNRSRVSWINAGIGTRISVYYITLLLVTIGICLMIIRYIYINSQYEKLKTISRQIIETTLLGINSTFTTADEMSRLVIYNSIVQDRMLEIDDSNYMKAYSNPQFPINVLIKEVLQNSVFKSIYIYTLDGYCFSGYTSEVGRLGEIDIYSMPWYKDALSQSGNYIIRLNAGGDFYNDYLKNYISIIRIINSINTLQPIGLSVVNIPITEIITKISGFTDKYSADMRISDINSGKIIKDFDMKACIPLEDMSASDQSEFYRQLSINKKNFYYYAYDDNDLGWRIECLLPADAIEDTSFAMNATLWLILLLGVLFVSVGAFVISKSITDPLKTLIASMDQVKRGDFSEIQIPERKDEIYHLIEGYNNMITRIEELIDDIIHEQTVKRRYELDVLHEQIKPHFLYNTFDAISYLALSSGNKEIYNIICALGRYYKTSLSKGSEIIPLSREIEIVKNYLYILGFRYNNLFTVNYDIDDSVLEYPILRLTLQPFVENAIYHGIKPKEEPGEIMISVHDTGDIITISIADTGVGMDEEEIKDILDNRKENHGSFGIWGTIQRLRLYYNRENVCRITGVPGEGTAVTLFIPKERMLSLETLPQLSKEGAQI